MLPPGSLPSSPQNCILAGRSSKNNCIKGASPSALACSIKRWRR
jgi:hypothetical protein